MADKAQDGADHPARSFGSMVHSAFAALVYRLDAHLRHQAGVFEYADDPGVIFRIGRETLHEELVFSDGIRLACGTPIIQLHLWSEHIPQVTESTSPIGWGRRMNRGLDYSLLQLEAFLVAHPELSHLQAVRADMAFGTAEQTHQLLRMCGRYGFEPAPVAQPSTWFARLHRLGENILLGMLILARNPRSARWDIFSRVRTPAVLARTELDRRYHGRLPELLDETAV